MLLSERLYTIGQSVDQLLNTLFGMLDLPWRFRLSIDRLTKVLDASHLVIDVIAETVAVLVSAQKRITAASSVHTHHLCSVAVHAYVPAIVCLHCLK